MYKFLLGSAVALALGTTTLSAAPTHKQGEIAGFAPAHDAQVWLAKGNGGGNGNGNKGGNGKLIKEGKANGNAGKVNGKGNGNGNANAGKAKGKPDKAERQANAGNGNGGNGKPEHAGGPKPKANGNGVEKASNGNGKAAKARGPYSAAEREEVVTRIVGTPAPAGRDMTRIIGATSLALLTPQMVWNDIPEDQLIAYSNCPPGLAKKDPPCVPPGLAKKGVTYDDWVSYDRDRYDEIWLERRDSWLGSDFGFDPDPDYLLLQSDQIASLFNLAPAPAGQRYGLIDGLPVLLDEQDYTSLLLVNQMAQVANIAPGVPISPTAALSQSELMSLYRLPQLGSGQNYSVVNGQIVQLNDPEYEILQMIRIARAIL